MQKKGTVFWITGLSGVGKTTVGRLLKERLLDAGEACVFFDGDMLREMLGHDYGYSVEDRLKLSRFYSHLAKNLSDQGVNVVMACIALFHEIHDWNRQNIEQYVEIFIQAPSNVLQKRNNKSVYCNDGEKQRNVCGIDIEPEFPKNPDILLENDFSNSEQLVARIWNFYYEDSKDRTRQFHLSC